MLPGMEMLGCPNLAVSPQVMQHIVQVESGANPYAIGVVGGRLARQPRSMEEALATARMLEDKVYNFSVGMAQINRTNLGRYGLDSYRKAFNACNNLAVGAQILAHCRDRARGDWSKAFSCYYSGDFTTGFRDGYVRKVYASMNGTAEAALVATPSTAVVATDPLPRTQSFAGASASARAMPPLVVHSGDNSDYRIAMRNMPMAAPAAAPASRLSPVTPGTVSIAPAPAAAPVMGSAAATSHGSTQLQQGVTRAPLPAASIHQPAQVEPTGTATDGVFEPRVRGPGDPAVVAADPVAATPIPRHDDADLRMEHHDAAFVF